MDNSLSQRLKILRTSYQLPVFEAEWVCGVSRSALNSWERGERIPSADGLYQISTSFGISLDWLFGISQIPYTHDSIILAESIQQPDVAITKVIGSYSSSYNFDDTLCRDYFDKSKRETYELAARGNILVYTLYIQKWHDFFAGHDGMGRVTTIQQQYRLQIAENGLYSALKTKYPSTYSLQR